MSMEMMQIDLVIWHMSKSGSFSLICHTLWLGFACKEDKISKLTQRKTLSQVESLYSGASMYTGDSPFFAEQHHP